MQERRREQRYPLAENVRRYVTLRLGERAETECVLLELSRHGIKVFSPISHPVGGFLACQLAIPEAITGKTISIRLRVRHCNPMDDGFVVGMEVLAVSDEVWFRVFERIYVFIVERAGEVY